MSFRIIQISDCHLYADPHREGYGGVNPYHSFRQVLLHAAEQRPDKVVFSGDLSSDDSVDSYRHFRTLVERLLPDTIIRVIPGNHDDTGVMQATLPSEWLWFNASEYQAGTGIIYLNSQFQGTQGNLSSKTLNWLSAELRNNAGPVIIFVHHHPLATGSFMDTHHWLNADDFLKVVQRSAPVYVLHGHIHHASERQQGNVLIWSAPSTCWQWAMTTEFGISTEPPGYRCIDIAGTTVTSEVFRITAGWYKEHTRN